MYSPPTGETSPTFANQNAAQWTPFFNTFDFSTTQNEPMALNPPILAPPLAPPIVHPSPPVSGSDEMRASDREFPPPPCTSAQVEVKEELESPEEEEMGPIDIQLRNVVCTFSVPCHIDLKQLARTACHVYYEKSKGVCLYLLKLMAFIIVLYGFQVLKKQMRNPRCYISIWSSGKVTIVGSNRYGTARRMLNTY